MLRWVWLAADPGPSGVLFAQALQPLSGAAFSLGPAYLIAELGGRKTVLLSTHILQEAEALCGSVLILDKGLVVARGSAEEIARELRGGERLRLLVRGAPADRVAVLAAAFPGAGVASCAPGEGDASVLELALADGPPALA